MINPIINEIRHAAEMIDKAVDLACLEVVHAQIHNIAATGATLVPIFTAIENSKTAFQVVVRASENNEFQNVAASAEACTQAAREIADAADAVLNKVSAAGIDARIAANALEEALSKFSSGAITKSAYKS